ncbi:MAG: hypothetical protein ACJ76P_02190 [Actinomycetota bacterium]
MMRKMLAALAATGLIGTLGLTVAHARAAGPTASYEPHLDPAHFVSTIDNTFFPLPVGRTLIYQGTKDGVSQTDRVHVTDRTKVIEGITATAVRDVAAHNSRVLEATTDYYAQDDRGNVWYLGENTKAYDANGHVDTSGSWMSGVNDGEPGIVMEANPQIPDAYRQEYLAGEAEDTAWIVDRGTTTTVPYGTIHDSLTSLEFARIEPDVIDQKIYGPGVGIVKEVAMTGEAEVAKLVKVID